MRDLLARGVECFVAVGAPVGHKELEREIEGQGGYLISTSRDFRNHIFMSDLSASRRIVCYLYERAGEDFCFFPCSNPLPGRFAALKEVFKHLSQEELQRELQRLTPDIQARLQQPQQARPMSFYDLYMANSQPLPPEPPSAIDEALSTLGRAPKQVATGLVNAALGMTPKQFLTRTLLNRACALLLRGNRLAREVALELGFTNEFYFSRFFRKQTGMTPQEFRKNKTMESRIEPLA